MSRISDLKHEEKNLLENLKRNQKEQREINVKEFCDERGLSIGDTVEFYDYNNTYYRGILMKFDFYSEHEIRCSHIRLYRDNGKLDKYHTQASYHQTMNLKKISEPITLQK